MKKLADYIGNTPIINLKDMGQCNNATIWGKLENLNPAGSIKDRACMSMLERAEKEKLIKPGKTTIIEASSGNTAMGLALCCRARGYSLSVVVPEDTATEKIELIKAYKARVILSPAQLGMLGAIQKAEEIARKSPDFYFLNQFANTADIDMHAEQTTWEIKNQILGPLDALVCGVGSGGTLMGLGAGLRKIYPEVKIVVVEPEECAIFSTGERGNHGICGISPGFIAQKIDPSIIDTIYTVSTEKAQECTKRLARKKGLLLGISSGACLYGAFEVCRDIRSGGNVMAIFCDAGEMYLGTDLYN